MDYMVGHDRMQHAVTMRAVLDRDGIVFIHEAVLQKRMRWRTPRERAPARSCGRHHGNISKNGRA
jgi:hypothetical protein